MFPRCDNQRHQEQKKKKNIKNTIPSIFSTADCGCACKPACKPVCSFLWCRYDNGLRSEGPFKSEKSASGYQKRWKSWRVKWSENIWSLREARQKKGGYLCWEQKGKTAAHHWSKHSVICTTGPLIRSALPVTALRNTSAWREVRPETVSSLQPPPSPAGRNKWHQQPVNSHPLWLNGML